MKFAISATSMELNTSWVHGKYPNINAEINTHLPYVSIGDYFFQGDEADNVINAIHAIWTAKDCTVEAAILEYQSLYL